MGYPNRKWFNNKVFDFLYSEMKKLSSLQAEKNSPVQFFTNVQLSETESAQSNSMIEK